MGIARLASSLVLLLALTLTGCSSAATEPAGASKAAAEKQSAYARRLEFIAKLDAAAKLRDASKYDESIDAYVAIAGASDVDTQSADQALLGATLALGSKVREFRLPGQLDALLKLYGQLPRGARPEAAQKACSDFLLEPVVDEAQVANEMLEDRRKFIKDLRDKGEADVLLTPDKDRLLTAAEAKAAVSKIDGLGMPKEYKELYVAVVPLAETMDQFLRDDAVRIKEDKYLDNADIRALEKSCDRLADAIWPVARHLDRLQPDWRNR